MRSMTYQLFARLFAFFACVMAASAQDTFRRIADLNPGGVGSFPSNFARFNNALYFSAYTHEFGREFWKYDGAGVTLVTNINDQTSDDGSGTQIGNDSVPTGFTPFNGALYFSAYDQRRGGELWKFNGTTAVRAADINPDRDDMVKLFQNSSWPYELTVFNNSLYFGADGGNGPMPSGFTLANYELWRYDGVRASLVTNIHANFGTNHSSYPNNLTVFNNALYFMADDGVHGYELWKHDGVQTVLFADINPGTNGSFSKYFVPYNGHLYFQAFNDAVGYELWRTDGVTVSLVTNLNPFGSSSPEEFTVHHNALYFRANDGVTGVELWKFDGTTATLVGDLNPSGDFAVKNLAVFGNDLFFAGDDGTHGWELWKYDGVAASLVMEINPSGDGFPEQFTVWNNALYFAATNAISGYEMWKCDGQSATLAADINPGPASSFPQYPMGFGTEVCFSANEGFFYDWELWSIKATRLLITAITRDPNGIRIAWVASGGTTNVVQVGDNVTGPFLDLSPPMILPGNGEVSADYLDSAPVEGARFYRIVQP